MVRGVHRSQRGARPAGQPVDLTGAAPCRRAAAGAGGRGREVAAAALDGDLPRSSARAIRRTPSSPSHDRPEPPTSLGRGTATARRRAPRAEGSRTARPRPRTRRASSPPREPAQKRAAGPPPAPGGRRQTSTPRPASARAFGASSRASVATMVLGPRRGEHLPVLRQRQRESTITRTASLPRPPPASRVVSRGSSFRTVLAPTRIASTRSRRWCTRARASSPVTHRESPVAVASFRPASPPPSG